MSLANGTIQNERRSVSESCSDLMERIPRAVTNVTVLSMNGALRVAIFIHVSALLFYLIFHKNY